MTTSPAVLPPIELPVTDPQDVPVWERWLISVLVGLLPILLAYFDPHHRVSSAAAQVALYLAGVILFALVHLVVLILHNGLTRAGVAKTVSEDEAWFKANATEIRTLFLAAKPALDAIPGVPAAMSDAAAHIAALEAHAAAVPATDITAVEALIRDLVPQLVIPQVLAVSPAASTATGTTAAPDVATPAPLSPATTAAAG